MHKVIFITLVFYLLPTDGNNHAICDIVKAQLEIAKAVGNDCSIGNVMVTTIWSGTNCQDAKQTHILDLAKFCEMQMPDKRNDIPQENDQLPQPSNQIPQLSNQLPDADNQTPDINDQIPHPSNAILKVNNRTPEVEDQIQEGIYQIPQRNNQIHEVDNQTPEVNDQIPQESNEIPVVYNQTSEVSNRIIEVDNQIPEVDNRTQGVNDQIPQPNNQIHEVDNQTPEVNDQIPQESNEIPVVYNQTSEVSNRIIEVDNQIPEVANRTQGVNDQIPQPNNQIHEVHNQTPEVNDQIPQENNQIPEENNTIAVPCYTTNDLVIVLDSSWSITSSHYETTKKFIKQLAEAFTVHRESRIAFMIYGNINMTIFDLRNNLNPTDISSSILSTKYLNQPTRTWVGVDAAINEFDRSPRSVPLNMVVLTGGASGSTYRTIKSSKKATHKGIRSFAVGIGSKTNKEELLALAGFNRDRVFDMANFNELIEILGPLSRKICY